MNNKIVLVGGVVFVLGVLFTTVVVWVAAIGAAKEEPSNLQAAEPSPKTPAPPPTPQEKQGSEANSQDPEEGNMSNVGEGVTFSSGAKVTVYSYSSPVQSNNEFSKPEAGTQFAAIDVEGCAGSQSGDENSLNPYYFSLQMPDNTRMRPTASVAEPALPLTNLLPGGCVRGLVTFQVPQGQGPSHVHFEQPFPKEVAEWSID